MKTEDLDVSYSSLHDPRRTQSSNRAHLLASEIKSHWDNGNTADACMMLGKYPHLLAHKSIVLDLAYEEFCQRVEAGEAIEPSEFCNRFPLYGQSLFRLIEIHGYLQRNPQLWEDNSADQWPRVGQSFLGFELLEELGRGAFARVFLASEPALGNRHVALKIARHGAAEAKTLGRLEHPNIVPVNSLHVDTAAGFTAICMPYLGKTTLCDVLSHTFRNSARPERAGVLLESLHENCPEIRSDQEDPALRNATYTEAVIHWTIQLADALAYAHQRGVCHCDLKPSNVLVTPTGRPMLLDFNLCHDERNSSRISWGGTIPYMSPELLSAMGPSKPDQLYTADARSDVFSLGVIFYELLCGSLPFGPIPWDWTWDQVRVELLSRQRSGPRPLACTGGDDRILNALIKRCLAFEANDRPGSAEEVRDVLRRFLSPWRQIRRRIRSRRRFVIAGAAAIMAGLSTGVFLLATRAPYSVRQLQLGVNSYQRKDFKEAIKLLTRAIDADPNFKAALFKRGRAYQQIGDLSSAMADYSACDRLGRDGQTLACMGHCLSLRKERDAAIFYFENATKLGFHNAAVLNNLGCHYADKLQYENAFDSFEQAIALDPTFQLAYYNRAMYVLKMTLEKGQPLPQTAFSDIETALTLGTPAVHLLRDAARIYGVSARNKPDHVEKTLEYLRQAVDRGIDPRSLKRDSTFKCLKGLPEFNAIVSSAPTEFRPERTHFVDPVAD